MSPTCLDFVSFVCASCGARFSISREMLEKHAELRPVLCPGCYRSAAGPEPGAAPAADRQGPATVAAMPATLERLLDQVLARHTAGPSEGLFTDGACSGNPGPGGWGVVYVQNDQLVARDHGHDPATTNNRMELTALIEGYRLLERIGVQDAVVWSDSQLCVNTFTLWAPKWEAMGWRRKGGPIKNLELVKTLYDLVRRHPGFKLRWLKAHAGSRWNEYADTLASWQLER